MAATAHGEVVKGPGSLVISAYCDMPDITKKVTPDFKLGDGGRIIMVDIAQGKRRTGGSALAQVSLPVLRLPSELAQKIRFAPSVRDDGVTRLCNQFLVSWSSRRKPSPCVVVLLSMQAFGQIGDSCPDIDDISLLKNAFNTVQQLLDEGLLSAGHDVSDGGVVTTLLEMAFAGNCGMQVCELRGFSSVVRSYHGAS